MSRAPFVMAKNSQAFGREIAMFDSTIGARFPNARIEATFGDDTMPQTADNIAQELNLTRTQADEFALASQQKYQHAKESGFFDGEIIPVEVPTAKRKVTVTMADDEHPRPDSSNETLASLRPLFTNGVVTAGNASGINDGAAALLLGSLSAGNRAGMSPRGRIIAGAVAGVAPRMMGLGPVDAIHKALKRANLTLNDMSVIEVNEAFAVQVLGCLHKLGIDSDDPRVNPNGGAIAVGHPLGASGTRLVLTALRQLEHTQQRYAVVSLCIGVGQGVAMVIERV